MVSGKRQLVEIARVLRQDVKVMILDEPTASLTEGETDILLSILTELKASGVSIIYISHKLDVVLQISDYITVPRRETAKRFLSLYPFADVSA